MDTGDEGFAWAGDVGTAVDVVSADEAESKGSAVVVGSYGDETRLNASVFD
jgi:hypothetical protein